MHVACLSVIWMTEVPNTGQQLILKVAVKTSPHTFVHHPSLPRKRLTLEKHWPGRPRKNPWLEEDWRQHWYEVCSTVWTWESYVSSVLSHFTDKPTKRACLSKKVSSNVHCRAEVHGTRVCTLSFWVFVLGSSQLLYTKINYVWHPQIRFKWRASQR